MRSACAADVQRSAQVANHTIAILLGLIYCIIQPVIAPVVMFYCLIALFIAKYQAIYVLRPAYESGGAVRSSSWRRFATGPASSGGCLRATWTASGSTSGPQQGWRSPGHPLAGHVAVLTWSCGCPAQRSCCLTSVPTLCHCVAAQMWPKVHTQVMTGLILAQLVLTCLFAIKKTVWAPILAAISILGSIIVHLSIVRQFNPPQAQMSYRAATNADHSDEARLYPRAPPALLVHDL